MGPSKSFIQILSQFYPDFLKDYTSPAIFGSGALTKMMKIL
jgi:hypothetical protein